MSKPVVAIVGRPNVGSLRYLMHLQVSVFQLYKIHRRYKRPYLCGGVMVRSQFYHDRYRRY